MNESTQASRVAPDSLVALLPVSWGPDEISIFEEVHPQVWAEALPRISSDDPTCAAAFQIGVSETPSLPPFEITLHIDEPIPELLELVDAAKHPFDPSERLQLENHSAIWRITMTGLAAAPVRKARAFARFLASAAEAGAPAVFLPSSFQLHSSQLIRHVSVDLNQPPALVNLYISAFNDDEWMVTRGLTSLGFPELETSVAGGLNAAYFRLLDVATELIVQEAPFRPGARLQLGPHLYEIQPGPRGPEDTAIPVCGAFGRLALLRPELDA